MTTVTLGGSIHSALTHFALLGLAEIAESTFGAGVTLGWSDAAVPRAWVEVPGASEDEVAQAVLDAARTESPRDWPSVRLTYASGATVSPFSPRIKAIDTDKHPNDWEKHQAERHIVFDALLEAGDWTELRWLDALGEASYWHVANNVRQPDRGASRWEMVSRQHGREFVSNRYSLICKEVARWPKKQVIDGVTGVQVRDVIGKQKTASRSSTGLTPPGPADNALVFCALRGIAAFPLAHRVEEINATPGAWPATVLHPKSMLLPVPTAPVTPARLRSVLVSSQLADLHTAMMTIDSDQENRKSLALEADAARAWLAARMCRAVVRFPILKAGSDSAPERQVLEGEVHLNVR
ncbi:aldehyde dehydrogenase [Corynebacterium pelargi]|uniref:Uncharacterized protein n=1 Tax=Corynebacterium pelargi TaxID=1471400 RepID=A0A410W6E7_9CORY|nr:aldehyde dehydrogenase [Corynebacterium pelargi]QAU51454.1 hypothetical protein CPELA_00765 [Corynebacterium pelargi]GGG79288.1 hypothetical protein GCM10007338_16950 [Corynebacterium pelargi]